MPKIYEECKTYMGDTTISFESIVITDEVLKQCKYKIAIVHKIDIKEEESITIKYN